MHKTGKMWSMNANIFSFVLHNTHNPHVACSALYIWLNFFYSWKHKNLEYVCEMGLHICSCLMTISCQKQRLWMPVGCTNAMPTPHASKGIKRSSNERKLSTNCLHLISNRTPLYIASIGCSQFVSDTSGIFVCLWVGLCVFLQPKSFFKPMGTELLV